MCSRAWPLWTTLPSTEELIEHIVHVHVHSAKTAKSLPSIRPSRRMPKLVIHGALFTIAHHLVSLLQLVELLLRVCALVSVWMKLLGLLVVALLYLCGRGIPRDTEYLVEVTLFRPRN